MISSDHHSIASHSNDEIASGTTTPTTTRRRGLLISVEGCDRGGKTTQCYLLKEYMAAREQPAEYLKLPRRTTPIGKLINAHLTDPSMSLNDRSVFLLFAANFWEVKDEMMDNLDGGTSLVMDRYFHSGMAYACAKGLPYEWCETPYHGLPKPDLVIFIDVPIAEREGRQGWGEERYEKHDFQLQVRSKFEEMRSDDWIMIDGQGSIEQVHQRIISSLEGRLDIIQGPLGIF